MSPQEYCDQLGAAQLKQKIEAYWEARGHKVEVKLVEAGFVHAMRSRRIDVRSNLRNGLPLPASRSQAA